MEGAQQGISLRRFEVTTVLDRVSGLETLSKAGRRLLLSRPGEPLFIAGWERALFLHYEVEAERLQRLVPFALDLREGKAYVSLVAFAMRDLRPRVGGAIGRWAFAPIATHSFLNLRTYVCEKGERGIHFMAEWIPNRLAAALGPRTFGLPYRLGTIDSWHEHESGRIEGEMAAWDDGGELRYEAELAGWPEGKVSEKGSLEEFLLERYTAYTCRGKQKMFFRVWHPPWRQENLEVNVEVDSLLGGVVGEARFVGANYSVGVDEVWMGWPHIFKGEEDDENNVWS